MRQLIETAQKEFARQLPAALFGELDRLDLMELIKNLRKENESMKRDLLASQKRVRNWRQCLVKHVERHSSDANIAPLPQANRWYSSANSGPVEPEQYHVLRSAVR